MFRRALTAVVLAALLAATLATPAAAQVQPYGTNDFGGFRNILPPGTSGLDNLLSLLSYELTGTRPPHNDDQLAMYARLASTAPNILPSQVGSFFKDATFGVPGGEDASRESPEPGATIVRDSRFGVPHIYGDTRGALMFGIGYATAEDRLFFIDALRHYGRGELAQFAGGANAGMDEAVWASEPYTEQDLANQVSFVATHAPHGPQILRDATSYVAGINAYIARAQNPLLAVTTLPAEYVALGITPRPFTLEDLVSIAALVGGIFGKGGGAQLSNAVLYEDLRRRFGAERFAVAGSPELGSHARADAARVGRHSRHHHTRTRGRRRTRDRSGFATLLSLVDPNDPEAPTTVRRRSFPYQTLPVPTRSTLSKLALPDPGSVRYSGTVAAGAVPAIARGAAMARTTAPASATRIPPVTQRSRANAGPGLLAFPRSASNALLVSGAHTVSGHPIAVMGPQVGYFSPQILMEEDIHGPGIDADGASFPGVNLYVELGHGRDYAWSATSSGQNIIDTFALPLCRPGPGPVSIDSDHYLLHGQCVPMETLTRSESWQPSLADPTPAGAVTFRAQRTAFGIVIARATIHGRPVAYANLRSTYMHELDSVEGFFRYNDPASIRSAQDFFHASYSVDYTFNWFYADDRHIGYFNSGLNPVRAPGTDPLFPTWARFAWRGYQGAARSTPSSLTESQTPQRAHPQTIDQAYLTSWNNKQARGYGSAGTGQQYASVYRSQLLDRSIGSFVHGGRSKLTLTDAINAMGSAGTQDLRGVEVLPYALRVIGDPSDPALSPALGELRAWAASGAHRVNRLHSGASGNYEQTDAIRIMDAWWPLLVKAELTPVLGPALLDEIEAAFPINDEPGHGTGGAHLGSAWDVGFYGIVQKDLRSVAHRRVAGALNRVYCGAGSLTACRSALERSLSQAIAQTAGQVYPGDGVCAAGDQKCSDSIQFRAIGAIAQPLVPWVNRPTFQQAVEIQGHAPR